jgi:hypothetical protein
VGNQVGAYGPSIRLQNGAQCGSRFKMNQAIRFHLNMNPIHARR